jgi:hypothetical protein
MQQAEAAAASPQQVRAARTLQPKAAKQAWQPAVRLEWSAPKVVQPREAALQGGRQAQHASAALSRARANRETGQELLVMAALLRGSEAAAAQERALNLVPEAV